MEQGTANTQGKREIMEQGTAEPSAIETKAIEPQVTPVVEEEMAKLKEEDIAAGIRYRHAAEKSLKEKGWSPSIATKWLDTVEAVLEPCVEGENQIVEVDVDKGRKVYLRVLPKAEARDLMIKMSDRLAESGLDLITALRDKAFGPELFNFDIGVMESKCYGELPKAAKLLAKNIAIRAESQKILTKLVETGRRPTITIQKIAGLGPYVCLLSPSKEGMTAAPEMAIANTGNLGWFTRKVGWLIPGVASASKADMKLKGFKFS